MTTTFLRLAFAVAATLMAAGGPIFAQGPAPAQPAKPPAPAPAQPAGAKPAPAQPAPPEAPAYTYQPEGRRDPFVSLLVRGSDPASAASRPPGLPGLLINEVVVKGIVRDKSGFIGMIQGPDTKTHIVRAGDRLMDGTVKSITADTVVFSQDVTDPLSLVKQREVRKAVRPLEGGRG
jgi:type IV pilus assembly protein PilP